MIVTVVAVVVIASALAARAALGARRRLCERLAAASGLLGYPEGAEPTLEASVANVERAVGEAVAAAASTRSHLSWTMRALEVIPEGVVIVDDQGDQIFRNEVARSLAGSRHTERLVEHEVEEALAGALQGHPARKSVDLVGPPRRVLVISGVPVDDGSRTTGALAVIDDVSEQRRLESVRRDFVANISHELKTPVGALGLLAETITSELDPTVTRRLAERMTGEAIRVGRIIDDLLVLSRIEAEEKPVRELLVVRDLVLEALDRVLTLAGANDIVVAVSGVNRCHLVRGDRRQLVSALGNLLENACKYSDPGSTVTVTSSGDASWVEIAVADDGVGIPTADLERVFERFYRVDRARSRETGGTGLGLAIVRHVAGNHGGEVQVISHEGDGSTFTLRLPAGAHP